MRLIVGLKSIGSLLSLVGMLVIVTAASSQEAKNPLAVGKQIGSEPAKVMAIDLTKDQKTSKPFVQLGSDANPQAMLALASTASPGSFSGVFSIGESSTNGHFLGMVKAGKSYTIEVSGVGDFDPIAMTVRAVLNTSSPEAVPIINDDCGGGTSSCISGTAGSDGALVLFVRAFGGKAGKYRIAVNIED